MLLGGTQPKRKKFIMFLFTNNKQPQKNGDSS